MKPSANFIMQQSQEKHGQAWISAKFNENLPPKQIGQAEAFGDIFKSIRLKFLADFGNRVVYGRMTAERELHYNNTNSNILS